MQTESGMQLILLGGPPLKSETVMGLSIDGVSRTRQVVLVPVSGTNTANKAKHHQWLFIFCSICFLLSLFFFLIHPESNRDADLKGGEMFR